METCNLPNAVLALTVPLSLSVMCACEEPGASGATPDEPYTSFFTQLPSVAVFPEDNQFSLEKRDLGEALFWDPVLSGRQNVACASCHHPAHGWADGRKLSVGVDGRGLGPDREGRATTRVNSPSVLNVAFTGLKQTEPDADFVSGNYFWDLRAGTLEEQALGPIQDELEMRSEDFSQEEILPEVVRRLEAIVEYEELFRAAFDDAEPVRPENIAKALATYQRTLTTKRTRFDQFISGDEAALTNAEITGLNKFINGGCVDCHSGPMLSDNQIDEDRRVQRARPGVRTPSLRNVELTAPYMHDGSRNSLRDAIALYEERGDLGVLLDDEDFGDIDRFLRTLTDDTYPRRVPDAVPSRLPVGGEID